MAAVAFTTLVLSQLASAAPPSRSTIETVRSVPTDQLSVMTYNVAGLPFPVALDRTGPLQEIGSRLAGLRQQGLQPHVVLLQEAFTPEAKSIAALSGYRFVAQGPDAVDLVSQSASAMPAAFRAARSWRKGETEGKWVDSGLMVMSDYPIIRVAKMAFQPDACAGFDCLAAKGVLVTWIKVPGQAEPLAIADTHMNSRHATGVSDARADAAFAEQLREARRFVADQVPKTTSVVFGGDFNIGHAPERLAQIGAAAPLAGANGEAIARVDTLDPGNLADRNLQAVVTRGKDKEFFRAGSGKRLRLAAVEVPFGISRGGYDLSDHLGYIASYVMR